MTRLLGFQVLLGLAVCAHPKVHVIRLQTPKLLSYEDVPQIPSIAKDSALLCSSVASANCAALHARPSHRSFQTTVKTGEDVSEMIDLTQLGGMLRDFGFSEDEIDAAIETAGRFEFRISEDNADDNADTDAASSGSDEEQTRLRIEEDDLQITADADYFKDLSDEEFYEMLLQAMELQNGGEAFFADFELESTRHKNKNEKKQETQAEEQEESTGD